MKQRQRSSSGLACLVYQQIPAAHEYLLILFTYRRVSSRGHREEVGDGIQRQTQSPADCAMLVF